MILRIWRGRVPEERAAEYGKLMNQVAVADYQNISGNMGAWCWESRVAGFSDFMMMSLWKDEESIQHFAGSDINIARYYEFDREFLIEMPKYVEHFRLVNA